jgi:hypothetical protein
MTASAATACAELDTDAAENLPARLFVPLGVRIPAMKGGPRCLKVRPVVVRERRIGDLFLSKPI